MSETALSRQEAAVRAGLVSDVSYEVSLDLSTDDATFSSETIVRFSCAEAGASTFLDLDAVDVEEVTLDGRLLAGKVFAAGRITLEGLATEHEVRVRARCAYQRTGVGLHRFVDPVDDRTYLHSQFEPFDAHRVFACFDQPDIKATVGLHVRAPRDWVVVSNGEVTERDEEGEATQWQFATTPPISTYLVAVVAGEYHHEHDRHGDVPLGVYCRQSLAQHLDTAEFLEVTKQGLDFYSERFAYPYPFGKYDQLFVPEFNAGAMENPGCVTFSEGYLFRSRVTAAAYRARAVTVLHEMAHMWFGDLVTMRWWDDLWLNESFATYTSYLAAAEGTRFTDAWASFAGQIKAWAYAQDQLPSTHPIVADMTDTASVRVLFDGITYAKGASVLKQLVHWVGADAFTNGLRAYFRRHEWGNAELRDFLAALEEHSGRDLGAWAQQWLQRAGVNTLHLELEDQDGTYAGGAVVQDAPADHPTLRDHRLGVGLYDLDGDRLERREHLQLDVTGARTPVEALAGRRVADLVLLNDADLAYAKVRLDARSLETVTAHLGGLVDPLARTVAWGAAWDMTRDAELPARRFVALVARHAAGETDPGLLQTLIAQALATLHRYVDPGARPEVRRRLADAAEAAVTAAQAGSDPQLLWLRTFASTAADDAGTDRVRALLDGRETLPGVEMDTELRWHLVTALAARGTLTDDAIRAEETRDPSDIGRRHGLTARAARPDAEAKQRAWTDLTSRRDLPLASLRAVVAGFGWPGQDDLVEPYLDAYPDAVAAAWKERSTEEALLLTPGLLPPIIGQKAVAVCDRALDGALPAPAQRLVREARDGLQRALRARSLDRAEGDAAD